MHLNKTPREQQNLDFYYFSRYFSLDLKILLRFHFTELFLCALMWFKKKI